MYDWELALVFIVLCHFHLKIEWDFPAQEKAKTVSQVSKNARFLRDLGKSDKPYRN